MASKEGIGFQGHVEYRLFDSEMNLKEYREKDNLVPNAGMVEIVKLMIGSAADPFDNIAIGTGSTNFAATSTQLNNEYKRTTGSTAADTTTFAGDTAKIIATFSITETKAIVESGLLNAAAVGDMVAAQTFSALNVASGDTLEITWKVSLKD